MNTNYNEMEENLKNYVLEKCRSFMLPHEIKAFDRTRFNQEERLNDSPLVKWKTNQLFGFDDEKANALFLLGKEQVENKIAERILKEHPEALNLCPLCRKLARTPFARQCRYCGHDWH